MRLETHNPQLVGPHPDFRSAKFVVHSASSFRWNEGSLGLFSCGTAFASESCAEHLDHTSSHVANIDFSSPYHLWLAEVPIYLYTITRIVFKEDNTVILKEGPLAMNRLKAMAILLPFTAAWRPPEYPGLYLLWHDDFVGDQGGLPCETKWNTITGNLGVNEELQFYTGSNLNVQLSGAETLQLVPWYDRGIWTSARLESKYTLVPIAQKITRIEAMVRLGPQGPEQKRGVWPAWWMLGDSIRHGAGWPGCGELDIMENINGKLIGHGTLHCDVFPGGICNEGLGINNNVSFSAKDWHVWRLEIDRTPGSWLQEVIVWYLDGEEFHRVSGRGIQKYSVWCSLTRSPLFMILNVAMGGKWVSLNNLCPL